MNYKCRPGIVLTKICGQWLLIPTREASEHCSSIIHLKMPAFIVWYMIEKGKPEEDIYKALGILMHRPEDEVKEAANTIIQTLIEKQALMEE